MVIELGIRHCIRQHWWSLIPPLGVIEFGNVMGIYSYKGLGNSVGQ